MFKCSNENDSNFLFTNFGDRYIWSVIPSLLAWPALLLDPVPQFSVLISSLLLVFVDLQTVSLLSTDSCGSCTFSHEATVLGSIPCPM